MALLACAVITRISYPPFLNDCVAVVVSKISRRYADTTRTSAFVFSRLFLLGTMALCLWLCLYADGSLHWLQYGLLVVLVSVWLLLRYLVSRFLGYVFSIRQQTQAVHEDSMLLLMLVGLVFYGVCCLAPVLPDHTPVRAIAAVVMSLYVLVLTAKVVVTYARSFRMLFYIFLYILTLEIIPLAMLYGVASYITVLV